METTPKSDKQPHTPSMFTDQGEVDTKLKAKLAEINMNYENEANRAKGEEALERLRELQ